MLALTAIKFLVSPGKEVVRKGFHLFCGFSVFILMYVFQSWQAAAFTITAFFLTALVYLVLEEKVFPIRIFDLDREEDGDIREINRQVVLVLSMQVILIVVFRSLLAAPIHAVAGMLLWGTGDAVAAVVGSRFGRRGFPGAIMASSKTLEGTSALVFTTWLTALFLGYMAPELTFSFPLVFLYGLILALTAGLAEGVSRKGTDSLTMPLAVAFVSLLFTIIFV